jgi:REP element-mobilizing transposase RayT
VSDTEDRFHRRPLRLEWLFARLDACYFVTFNTSRRAHLLAHPQVHNAFRIFCVRAYDEHDIAVGRYVLMPDHAHLFVVVPATGITLSKWVQALKSVLGKELLRLGFQKPHWQEGFFDHVLRNSDSYSEKWDYVRMNPVRAGFCREPEDWEYQGEVVSIQY